MGQVRRVLGRIYRGYLADPGQGKLNEDLLKMLEDLRTGLAETQSTADLLTDLRTRVIRMERTLREAVRPGVSGDER